MSDTHALWLIRYPSAGVLRDKHGVAIRRARDSHGRGLSKALRHAL